VLDESSPDQVASWISAAGAGQAHIHDLTDNDALPIQLTAQAGIPGNWILRAETAGEPKCLCVADIDGSGDVGFSDLVRLLAAWGPCPGCAEDLNDDGTAGATDLFTVLGNWGLCP